MIKKIGKYKVQDVMIEVDDTNIEEGIDVYVDGEYTGEVVGRSASEDITEDELDYMFS